MPDMDDGCFSGSISVEKGFDGGSGGFDIDSLELAIGVSGKSVNGLLTTPPILPIFHLTASILHRLVFPYYSISLPLCINPVPA